MRKTRLQSMTPLLAAASLLAAAPAWSQGANPPGNAGGSEDAVLKRIDALTKEIDELRTQVKANAVKANETSAQVQALTSHPVSPVVDASETESLTAETAKALVGSVDEEPVGIDIVHSRKATLNFYGMIDVGAEALSGKLKDGHNASAIRVSNGIVTPHYGVIGRGQVARGLQASFDLEGSFGPDNGVSGIGGRQFGRQAWVGLSGRFGTLRLGRQYTAVRMGFADANPYGTGNQGLRLLDPRISNPRADNSITYIGRFGPVTASANYSAGWDAVNGNSANAGPANSAGANCPGEVPDATQQCREWSVGAKYERASWGLAASHEQLNGGTSSTFGGLTAPNKTDKRTVLGAYLKLSGGTKLTAGWINRNNAGNATPKSNLYWTEAIVPVGGPFFVDGLLGELKYADSADKAVLLNVRGRYVLTKDTTFYVTAAHMGNSGKLALPATASTPFPTPIAGGKQTSVIAGVLYRF